MKIVIAGIGGVGGYFGGLLAKQYFDSDEVEIVFFARNEHLKQIQNHGLKVIKGKDEFIAKPSLATDQVKEIGIADFVLLCTKSYDLETILDQLKPCIDENTFLLPLLNGVDAAERIKTILPDVTVLEGCVYTVSRLKEAGVVENTGNVQTLFFGLNHATNDKLLLLEKILKDAGIEATLSDKISTLLWEKFIFISPTATATSYFNTSIGRLIEENQEILLKLIEEVKNIAIAKGLQIEQTIVEKTLNKLKSLPYETTSSMHNDFKNGKPQTELPSLTTYVLKAGKQLEIETPTYNFLYQQLKEKKTS